MLAALDAAAFDRVCGSGRANHSHCTSLAPLLRAYASFHRRVFSPATPCAARRVLLVRESFRDVVGLGHARMGLHRMLPLAIALGRALVLSSCEAADDRWQVRGRRLFKRAAPYDCAQPHLRLARLYEGRGGVDLRAMECDTRARAGCPSLDAAFARVAPAGLLALYNARRDAGLHAAPTWILRLANGFAHLPAPNGSSVGLAADAALRDALSCPYACWAAAALLPSRAAAARADRTLASLGGAPAACVHARTLWVDDGRCFPNPRGCHAVDFRRLTYWNTSAAVDHSGGPRGGATAAIDGREGEGHDSLTLAAASPVWWRLRFGGALRVCAVRLVEGRRGEMRLRRVSVALLDAHGRTAWRAAELQPEGRVVSAAPPRPVEAHALRVERAYGGGGRGSMSLAAVEVRADEPLHWAAADARAAAPCKLLAWRGACGGGGTALPRLGGWSGVLRCARTAEMARRLARGRRGGGKVYLSSDAPALLQLAEETFPESYGAVEGTPVPSWKAGLREEDYEKVVVDFEILKLCGFIAGPVSSRYARTAAEMSLHKPRYVNSATFCALGRAAARAAAGGPPSPATRRCVAINASQPVRLREDE
ncbi:hypothetical protein AB1Y20_011537 [Prymnesium parvum]|uniref:Uncharacterized protein n=1 Tax=Prymnesium parvum TaxID=97485 RepID=A0AB34IGN2_PRYPA